MRVTDKMLFRQAASRTGAARDRAQQAVNQAATGLRVSHPGDDPAASGMIVTRRGDNIRLRAIQEATARTTDELVAADRVLGGVLNVVSRARDLAVQLGNDTFAGPERSAAGVEVRGLLRDALLQLNSRVGDRYIFGGFKDGSPPFDSTTGAYLGDDNQRVVEVAPGIYEAASVRADVYVKGQTLPGGVDIVETMNELADALAANDGDGVRALLSDLDKGLNQLAEGRAQAGTSMNIIETATSAASNAFTEGTIALSRIEDADIAEAATRLALSQRALEAAMTASMKSFELTLLNKM